MQNRARLGLAPVRLGRGPEYWHDLKKTNHPNFANVQESFTLLGDVSENGFPDNLGTNRDHFRDRLGPVESSGDDEKVRKLQLWAQTGRRRSVPIIVI